MKVVYLSLPSVDVEPVNPAPIVIVLSLGYLIITIPDPPALAVVDSGSVPPPPPPVFTVPAVPLL